MMFREKSINKLYAFALAGVFVLAGCGGGGGGTTMDDDMDTVMCTAPQVEMNGQCVDPPPSAAEMAATAAANAAAAAKTIADGISDDDAVAEQKTAAMRAYMDAQAAATAAQTAADADDEVEAKVQQRLAENARDDAQTYANAATTALNDAAAAAAKAANNNMVLTKVTAISNEAAGTATRPFDSTSAFDPAATDNSAANYGVAIKYDDGAMVTITDGAMVAKNDPTFEMMDGKYVRDNGGGESEIVSVMTDIEAPESMAFSKVYSLTLNDDPDRTGDQFSSYAVQATDNGKIASGEFPSTPGTDRAFDPDDAATDDKNEGQFRGTFDGAPGMFECVSATTCTISTDDEGEIEALTAADWEFTPDDGAMVSVADSDYLHYGFWLKKTVTDGVTTYNEVQTFAGSSLAVTTNAANVADGSAKYEGGAHGVYTHHTVNPDSSVDSRSAGTFTADVALTAYFGEETSVPSDMHNSVQGKVSNFELSGGEANTWEVTLAMDSGGSTPIGSGFRGTAMGMTGDTSAWSGVFHGDGADLDGAGSGTDVAPPPVVVGEFNANFSNGSVAGAYGARYMKE